LNKVNLTSGQYFGEEVMVKANQFVKMNVTNYDTQSMIGLHTHDNDYLSVLIMGSYEEMAEQGRSAVGPGEIIYRPAGYEHANSFVAEGRCFNIELDPGFEEAFDCHLPDQFLKQKSGSFPLFYQLYLSDKGGFNPYSAEECVLNWLVEIGAEKPQKAALGWIERTKQILDEELHVFHALADLSERVHVHPVYLARKFKQRTGQTVGAYQLTRKLESAFSKLLKEDTSITQISLTHGFFDDAHFIRSFRARYGMAPHQFRIQLKS
jgi:AraC family transcriptional regulator